MSGERTEHVCSRCNGTGRRVLSGQRQRVLDAVRARGTAAPCEVTDVLDGVDTATAMSRAANVCAWLAREGFLRAVKRDGKRTLYAPATNEVTKEDGDDDDVGARSARRDGRRRDD